MAELHSITLVQRSVKRKQIINYEWKHTTKKKNKKIQQNILYGLKLMSESAVGKYFNMLCCGTLH
jgi:hypothetical protein